MVQSLEINYVAYGEDMFCMSCGKQILHSEDSPTACSHVLFIATDYGYDYQSDLVKDILPAFDIDDEDEKDDKYFVDRLKEVTGFPAGSFIIESYAPAPSWFGLYLGFSPHTV